MAPSSVGSSTIIAGWVLTAITLLCVSAHLFTRLSRSIKSSIDDYLLYISFILSLALMAFTTYSVAIQGQGRHLADESRSQIEGAAESLLVNEILWSLVNTFMRLAAISFLSRIFAGGITRSWPWLVWLLSCTSVAYGITVIVVALAICRPIRASWDATVAGGQCGNEVMAYLILEVVALVIDFVIIVAPLGTLNRLKLPVRKRLALLGLFSFGSLVFIITGLRLAALNRVNTLDFTYDRGYIGLLSILGPLVGIICCCVTADGAYLWRQMEQWAASKKPNNGPSFIFRQYASLATRLSRSLGRRVGTPVDVESCAVPDSHAATVRLHVKHDSLANDISIVSIAGPYSLDPTPSISHLSSSSLSSRMEVSTAIDTDRFVPSHIEPQPEELPQPLKIERDVKNIDTSATAVAGDGGDATSIRSCPAIMVRHYNSDVS
ncbi:hypothetical protein B0T17DRAFT_241109 [Bombardia bombarda]|uniref:Rhodopsin domain-containing protein n=1 Tax=Bombardia bombarda TaxID=252184 RepID=A0AA39XDC9_9PEZI|nr:hypothetical protein B0T17DRAFT_241109 [Bombardia bombarda]